MTENCKFRKAILPAFYNISQRNFGILLILRCSFKLWWNFCLDQNLVYNANGPLDWINRSHFLWFTAPISLQQQYTPACSSSSAPCPRRKNLPNIIIPCCQGYCLNPNRWEYITNAIDGNLCHRSGASCIKLLITFLITIL